MLRPQFQQKLRLAFVMLASALIILAEPAYAKNSNGNSGRSNRAASSARESSQRSAPARSAAPAPSRSAAPAPRAVQPSRTIQQPARSAPQPSRPVQQPSVTIRQPSMSIQQPSRTIQQPSRSVQQPSITIQQPSRPTQSRNFTISPQATQPQTRSNNSFSTNSGISSRTNTIRQPDNTPSVTRQSTISSELRNSLGFSIGSENRGLGSQNSLRSNSIFNRETTGSTANNSISRNNSITNRNTESIISSNGARQPAASSNNRISSELSSHIGNTIGTQPQSTTTVRDRENRSSGNRIFLPFDTQSGSQRTSPQTEVQRPAASSTNRISSDISSRIGGRIENQQNSSSRTERTQPSSSTNRNKSIIDSTQRPNIVTPPSNSARQPAGRDSTSSIDRANTDIGIMISPNRTPPNEARQPAAGLNNRESRNSTNNQSRSQENSQSRERRQNSVGNTGRAESSIGSTIGTRERDNASSNNRIRQSQENARTNIGGSTGGRTDRRNDRLQTGRDTNNDNNIEFRSSTDSTRTSTIDSSTLERGTRITTEGGRRDLRANSHRYDTVPSSQVVYRDRPYSRDSYHRDYYFVDRYDNLYRRYISPGFSFSICYDRGSWLTFGYVFPYYQRKYLFVSLDGYWPYDYTYMRYYWYGYHPYYWYGYYPIARQVGTNTNYYYTYNYYYDDPAGYNTNETLSSQYYDSIIRQPDRQPSQPTLADTYFEEAVNAFEKGNYDQAVEKFSRAMELAPNDMVLPFAYTQALFAAGRYSDAAEVLRTALAKSKPDKDGVFFPRGLYPNDDVLLTQLDKLSKQADQYSFDPDLQLLLGYQLLGINKLDEAVTPLKNASLDMKNQQAAAILLNLLAKIKANDLKSETPEVPQQEEPQQVLPEKIVPEENPLPEKIEPNKALMNQPDTIKLDTENMVFIDSNAQPVQAANTENENIETIHEAGLQNSANEQSHQKAKEGILLATLFVIAGSTGLGHFMHH